MYIGAAIDSFASVQSCLRRLWWLILFLYAARMHSRRPDGRCFAKLLNTAASFGARVGVAFLRGAQHSRLDRSTCTPSLSRMVARVPLHAPIGLGPGARTRVRSDPAWARSAHARARSGPGRHRMAAPGGRESDAARARSARVRAPGPSRIGTRARARSGPKPDRSAHAHARSHPA